MKSRTSFGVILQRFFSEHLLVHRRSSPRTVISYRDTFRLLLRFLYEKAGIMPSNLLIKDLDAPVILSFLDDLEQRRGNSVRTRNVRLAAIRSFFRFFVFCDPENIPIATRVLSIPVKQPTRHLVGYLTRTEIQAILNTPDRSTWTGRRDHAMLLTFYNSGARVSEMIGLKRSLVTLGPSPFLHLQGKGRKDRDVPVWRKTARVLKVWFHEIRCIPDDTAFPNARGTSLSSGGVSYILRKVVNAAAVDCPSLTGKRVTPHVLRHSTAMHLLQSGVDISIIALWLGHESIETTHLYIQADMTTKERALQKLAPIGGKVGRFKAEDPLLAFLSAL